MYNTCKKHVKAVARSVQHRYTIRIRQLEQHIESLNCSLDYYRHYCLKLIPPIPTVQPVTETTKLPNFESVKSVTETELPEIQYVKSVIETELPTIESVKSLTEAELPTIESVKSVTETELPITEPVKSISETELSTTELVNSVTEIELPITEPVKPEEKQPYKVPTIHVDNVEPHLLLEVFLEHSALNDTETELSRTIEVTESIDPRCYHIKNLFKQTSLQTTANILTLIHSKLLTENEINILLTKNLRKNSNGRIDPLILQSLQNYLISHSKLYHENNHVETSKRFLKAASRRCRLF